MLYGCYEHTIDKKNRVQIPAKLREQMSESLIICKHVEEKCIAVYSEEEWAKIEEKINKLPTVESGVFVRRIFSHMSIVQLDTQGRVLIPQHLVDYAGLEKNVVVIGVNNHAEIWDAELHRTAEEAEDSPDVVETLKSLGF